MAFETLNAQASVRSRYLTQRPEPDTATFSLGEMQMIRWQNFELLVGEMVTPTLANVVGIQIVAPNIIGRQL